MFPVPFQDHDQIERAVLRDGSVVHIRQIHADDKESLTHAFERLSPDSRYRRFLGVVKRIGDRELRYLTEVDHVDHEALVATTIDLGELVAVARYVREPEDRAAAEVAIAVVDDRQGRGIGTVLLHELVKRANAAGIERFVALCLATNREAIELLEELGTTTESHPGSGVTRLSIELPTKAHRGTGLRRALRRAAAGELVVRPS